MREACDVSGLSIGARRQVCRAPLGPTATGRPSLPIGVIRVLARPAPTVRRGRGPIEEAISTLSLAAIRHVQILAKAATLPPVAAPTTSILGLSPNCQALCGAKAMRAAGQGHARPLVSGKTPAAGPMRRSSSRHSPSICTGCVGLAATEMAGEDGREALTRARRNSVILLREAISAVR